jgi:hypothetical protein
LAVGRWPLAVLFVAAFGRISFLNAARDARHNANG